MSPEVGLLYLQLALGVLLMAALAIAAEVGERERTAIASATAARFMEIADAAPAMLWVTDAADECVFLSRGWHEFTGQDASEGLGFAWTNAIHPDDRTATRRRPSWRRRPRGAPSRSTTGCAAPTAPTAG